MINELIEDCNNQIEWINKKDNMNVNALQFATYFLEQLKLVDNRTCSNCKHLEYIEKSYKRCEELDINIGHITQDEFYCAYWESKDGS